jgi:homoserine O-acetyltransferase
MIRSVIAAAVLMVLGAGCACAADEPTPQEGDFVVHDFAFKSGETLRDLRLHYTTFGKPVRDAHGRVTNAVLILHGTGGDGHQFIRPQFSGVLFGPRNSRCLKIFHHPARRHRAWEIIKAERWAARQIPAL